VTLIQIVASKRLITWKISLEKLMNFSENQQMRLRI